MAVFFNIIFLTLLVGIPTLLLAALAMVIARFCRARRWYLWGLSGPVVVAALVAGFYVWASRPERIFQQEFGFAPPATVVVHDAYSWALGDGGHGFVYFSADAATVQQIVSGWAVTGSPTSTNVEPPGWWKPRMAGSQQYFQRSGYGPANAGVAKTVSPPTFAAEDRWLIHDPNTGEVWYRFIGID